MQGAVCKGCVRCLLEAREGKGREGMGPMLYHRGTAIPPPSPAPPTLHPSAQLADSKSLLDDRSSRRDERAFALGVEKLFCWSL